jgi:hypothetical protein
MFRNLFPVVLGFLATGACAAHAGENDQAMAAIAAQCPAAKAWIDQHSLAATMPPDDDHVSAPALRSELHRRAMLDQNARAQWLADGLSPTSKFAASAQGIDGGNTVWLQALILKGGFPTPAQVGMQGVADAWLMVQHADQNPAFQSDVLALLAPMVQQGAIRASDYAMLVDRVRINQQQPQVYGSQYVEDASAPGKMRMLPVEDPAHLDQRRASVGLMPSHDYTCALSATYAPHDS